MRGNRHIHTDIHAQDEGHCWTSHQELCASWNSLSADCNHFWLSSHDSTLALTPSKLHAKPKLARVKRRGQRTALGIGQWDTALRKSITSVSCEERRHSSVVSPRF